MVRRSFLLILLMMVMVLFSCSKKDEQSFFAEKNLMELKLDNVEVKKVSYYDGNEIIVEAENQDIIYNKSDNFLSITSPKKTSINLQLPENKRYHIVYEDGNLYFDQQGLVYLGPDYGKVEMNGDTLQVTKDDLKVTLHNNGDILIVSNGNDELLINKEGFFTRKTDEWDEYLQEEDLSGFWGKLAAGVVRFAVKSAMEAIGETPEEVLVNVLKEHGWRNSIDEVLDKVNDKTGSFYGDKYQEVQTSVFSSEGINTLSIDNFNGPVIIKKSSNNEMKITTTISSDIEANLKNVELKEVDGKDFLIKGVALVTNSRCSIKYEVELPEGIALKDIETSNGRIVISETMGNCSLQTNNGSIEVEAHQGGLGLRTSNGKITVRNIEGNVYALSSNGAIVADDVKGRISAKTSNGKIDISDCDILERVETSNAKIYVEVNQITETTPVFSSNGSIVIVILAEQGLNIKASTSNGRIELHDMELDISSSSKTRLKAEYQGGGELLDIETSNANIDIYKNTDKE
ncbi:MAG: DUF4097 domain-containing protein [Candidatus Cloacimonetes bacterium]|nr:DUF4097 domain-containing protein [Candidatus Cloacimonadota bacterium]